MFAPRTRASTLFPTRRSSDRVIGEKVSLEEMGGARMHTSKSGCGHALVASDEEGIDFARRYLGYFPGSFVEAPPAAPPAADRKSTRLNSSHVAISYAVFCLKK